VLWAGGWTAWECGLIPCISSFLCTAKHRGWVWGQFIYLSKGENGHGMKLSGPEVKNCFPAHVFMPWYLINHKEFLFVV
jgi:hypothetical protein